MFQLLETRASNIATLIRKNNCCEKSGRSIQTGLDKFLTVGEHPCENGCPCVCVHECVRVCGRDREREGGKGESARMGGHRWEGVGAEVK